MTFAIPVWLIWIAGGLSLVAIISLAFLGLLFIFVMKDFKINW